MDSSDHGQLAVANESAKTAAELLAPKDAEDAEDLPKLPPHSPFGGPTTDAFSSVSSSHSSWWPRAYDARM
jgi:hypothetical protein